MICGAELGKLAWEWWGRFGVSVFPCSDAKRPLVKHWREEASCDEEEIVSLFANAGPRARAIGAAMGESCGLFAVDFDLYKGKGARDYMQTLLLAGCLPPTRVHETRSGGLHYIYFVPDGSAVPRNSVPADGVEIRGEGGYIIVPPTTGYKVQSAKTVEAPAALLTRLKRANDAFRALSVSGLIEKVIAGESFHEALTSIAAKMHSRGADPAEVSKTLMEAMQSSVAANPMHERHDRWSAIMRGKDGELARISASAYRKYNPQRDQVDVSNVTGILQKVKCSRTATVGGFFATKPADDKDGDGGDPISKVKNIVSNIPTTVDEFPFPRSYNANDVGDQDNKTFLLYPLVMEGDVIVLSAEPKAGKTLVAMNMCLHMATGEPIGEDLTPMDKTGEVAKIPVIYFALEGQGAIRKRVKAWLKEHNDRTGKTLGTDDLRLYVVEMPVNLGNDEAKQDLVDKILRANAFFNTRGWGDLGMVVFDTLTKAMPGKDQNSVEDTSAVFHVIDMLREAHLGCAVMFVHHNNRQSRAPRGSSNILAEPDTILSVRKVESIVVDDVQRKCHELSVYMARAIDDGQTYKFSAKDVEIGLNSQGIMESAPVLEIVEDYDAAPKQTDTILRKNAQQAKAVFYNWLWTTIADSNDMFMTFGQLRRSLEKVPSAAAFFSQYMNTNTKQGFNTAWAVLTAKEELPPDLAGITFDVDDNGVRMVLQQKEESSAAALRH